MFTMARDEMDGAARSAALLPVRPRRHARRQREHVLAWREALDSEETALCVWRIHRRIGMSGGLLVNMLLRETGVELSPERVERLQRVHADAFRRRIPNVRPLPGARALLAALTDAAIPAIPRTSTDLSSVTPSSTAPRRRRALEQRRAP
jgi:phosphoglycolate phosphatase-like HAD superfamily hydrolase